MISGRPKSHERERIERKACERQLELNAKFDMERGSAVPRPVPVAENTTTSCV